MIIISKRKEIIEIKTMVDLIMRMNYGNGDDNYEGSKVKIITMMMITALKRR